MRKINHKRYDKMDREDHEPGTVIERDGHFVVNRLPVIDGFTVHARKEPPKLPDSQWVEVIHRNGTRDFGPVECFAWRLFDCHDNVRMDYMLRKTVPTSSPAFAFIDFEITHYRLVETPPEGWVSGMEWPFHDQSDGAAA